MNFRRLGPCLLAGWIVIGIGTPLPVSAQTTKQRIEQQRRDIERRRREIQQQIARTFREVEQSRNQSNSARTSTSSGGGSRYKLPSSETRYVFQPGQTVAYAIEIKAKEPQEERYWAGVILLTTKKPTPLRSDGSPYGSANVSVWGYLEGYTKVREELRRDADEDIAFPQTLTFATAGVGDYKKPAGGRRRLPCYMSLRYSLINGIFPHAPLFAKNENTQEKRSFTVQTMYENTGRGYHSSVEGTADIAERTSGRAISVEERFMGSNKSGSEKIAYLTRQTGSFDSSGTLQRANTSFEIDWQGKQRVDVSVTQVPAEKVIAAFPTAQP